MSETPKFHKGKLGPISFSELNKVMGSIASVRPLIEMMGGSTESEKANFPKIMIVFASRDQALPSQFAWREVIFHNDEVLIEADEEYEEVEPTQQIRHGEPRDEKGVPLDTYAISLDPTFNSGFAICFSIMQSEGGKRYVLVPLKSGTSEDKSYRFLAITKTNGLNAYIPVSSGKDEPPSETIWAKKYTCQILEPSWTGEEVPPGNTPFMFVQGDTVTVYDVGWNHSNRPIVPGDTNLYERDLHIGTVIGMDQFIHEWPKGEGGSADPMYFISKLPRFDVECV